MAWDASRFLFMTGQRSMTIAIFALDQLNYGSGCLRHARANLQWERIFVPFIDALPRTLRFCRALVIKRNVKVADWRHRRLHSAVMSRLSGQSLRISCPCSHFLAWMIPLLNAGTLDQMRRNIGLLSYRPNLPPASEFSDFPTHLALHSALWRV